VDLVDSGAAAAHVPRPRRRPRPPRPRGPDPRRPPVRRVASRAEP
jgi:hypothetical protein